MDNFNLDDFDFGEFDTTNSGVDLNKPLAQTPNVNDIVTNLRKRSMLVIFVVDISGSMKGARIGAVNDAIRNVLPELKKKEKGNTAAEIKIAILEFSTNANWKTPQPCNLSDFNYDDITYVGGCTNFGNAFRELNEKLSRNGFLASSSGSYTPLIVLLTDGKPTDLMMYHEELDLLKRNKWFKYATRAGIAIEEGALSVECKKVLMEFTENEKNVYEAKNTLILAKQIQLVTLVGVDFVTQQGSLQNSPTTPTSNNMSSFNSVNSVNTSNPQSQSKVDLSYHRNSSSTQNGNSVPQVNNSSFDLPPMPEINDTQQKSQETTPQSPTIPLAEIDWENEFDF